MGAVNSKATARTGPWAPRKFPHLMTLRRQDTAYDMSTANNHIITTVGHCSHKNHNVITTHRHGQNLSRYTHAHQVLESLVRTAWHWREMEADPGPATVKHLLLRFYNARTSFWDTCMRASDSPMIAILNTESSFTFYALQMKQHTRGTTTRPQNLFWNWPVSDIQRNVTFCLDRYGSERRQATHHPTTLEALAWLPRSLAFIRLPPRPRGACI